MQKAYHRPPLSFVTRTKKSSASSAIMEPTRVKDVLCEGEGERVRVRERARRCGREREHDRGRQRASEMELGVLASDRPSLALKGLTLEYRHRTVEIEFVVDPSLTEHSVGGSTPFDRPP